MISEDIRKKPNFKKSNRVTDENNTRKRIMTKKNPYTDLLTPRGKKTVAKKVMQKAAATAAEKTAAKTVGKVFEKSLTSATTKAMTKAGVKTGAKVGTKVAGKTFLRAAANPWLLAADGIELGVGAACKKMDIEEEHAKIISKGSGLGSSLLIGAAVAGPLGVLAGGAIWCAGEGISKLFDW